MPGDVMRLADGAQKARRQPLGVARALRLALQDGKLVAAEATDQIRSAHRLAQAPGDAFQELIADGVPVGVVHILELVEIDPVDGKAVVRLQITQGMLELLRGNGNGWRSR